MGFILVYDITNEESFNAVQDWITQIKNYSIENAQVILVGNKCDMEEERVISTERGKQLADQLGVQFFETSAKENVNIKVTSRSNLKLKELGGSQSSSLSLSEVLEAETQLPLVSR